MGTRLAVWLLALAGCDQLFAIQHVPPGTSGDVGDAGDRHDALTADVPVKHCGAPGSGTATYNVGTTPFSVTLGDVDGNGSLDIVVPSWGSNAVSVLVNNGMGSFTHAPDVPTGFSPSRALVHDVDGNGTVDLLVAAYGSNALYLHRGSGNGSFDDGTVFTGPTTPIALAMGDVFGVGRIDYAVAAKGANQIQVFTWSPLTQGLAEVAYLDVVEQPQDLAIADVNNDQKNDFVVLGQKTSVLVTYLQIDSAFQPALPAVQVGMTPHALEMASLNNDVYPDVLVSAGPTAEIDLLQSTGSGTFTAQTPLPAGGSVYGFTVGDIDADGDQDLVFGQFDGPKQVRTYARSNGGFALPVDRNGTGAAEDVAIGNLDGLAPDDEVIVNWTEGTATVVLGCL